jgi:predicted chitinase
VKAAPKPKPAPKPAPKPTPAPAPKPASATDFKSTLGISNEKLASVLGISAASAKRNLPMLANAVREAGITNKNAIIAILATVKVEVGAFEPINEYGGPSYWAKYNGRASLGNRPGTNDGITYHGRGYIQLTGRYNYTTYGKKLGVDLVNHPEKALEPKIASKVLVQYFKDRGLVTKAANGDWRGVRLGVNGGTNGLSAFMSMVNKLKSATR